MHKICKPVLDKAMVHVSGGGIALETKIQWHRLDCARSASVKLARWHGAEMVDALVWRQR